MGLAEIGEKWDFRPQYLMQFMRGSQDEVRVSNLKENSCTVLPHLLILKDIDRHGRRCNMRYCLVMHSHEEGVKNAV
jgi:hypothetical protein